MNLDDVQLVAFDLDDTLAPSKSPLFPRMRELLVRLIAARPVAVISGGDFAQFRRQIVDEPTFRATVRLDRLHLLPACGTQYYRWVGDRWRVVYAEYLEIAERSRIARVLRDEAERLGLWESETWGPAVEDRGSQVTFSALGQEAPVAAKAGWDPDGSRRARLRDAVAPRLRGYEVRVGGSTSIDVTPLGIDKAYGLRRLSEHTTIPLEGMVFIGDQLQPGGNDHPVACAGVRTIAVTSWSDTAALLESALARP